MGTTELPTTYYQTKALKSKYLWDMGLKSYILNLDLFWFHISLMGMGLCTKLIQFMVKCRQVLNLNFKLASGIVISNVDVDSIQ